MGADLKRSAPSFYSNFVFLPDNNISAVVNSGVDKAIYTKMSGHKINTPHLSRYIEVSNETKKNVVDSICPMIDDKYESVLFNKNIG